MKVENKEGMIKVGLNTLTITLISSISYLLTMGVENITKPIILTALLSGLLSGIVGFREQTGLGSVRVKFQKKGQKFMSKIFIF